MPLIGGIVAPNKYRLSGYSTDGGCKLIKVERESLLKLFQKDPDIGYVVMSNLATLVGARFHNLQEEAARRGAKRAADNDQRLLRLEQAAGLESGAPVNPRQH